MQLPCLHGFLSRIGAVRISEQPSARVGHFKDAVFHIIDLRINLRLTASRFIEWPSGAVDGGPEESGNLEQALHVFESGVWDCLHLKGSALVPSNAVLTSAVE